MTAPSQQRLLEVAALLSQDAARILADLEQSSQVYLLQTVTVAIDYWENAGVQLDPVQFDIIITSIVASIAPTVRTLDEALMLLDKGDPECERSTS